MRIFLAFGLALMIGMLFLFWQPAPPPAVSDDPDLSLPAFAGCAADTDSQAEAVTELLARDGLQAKVATDLGGRPRAVLLTWIA